MTARYSTRVYVGYGNKNKEYYILLQGPIYLYIEINLIWFSGLAVKALPGRYTYFRVYIIDMDLYCLFGNLSVDGCPYLRENDTSGRLKCHRYS